MWQTRTQQPDNKKQTKTQNNCKRKHNKKHVCFLCFSMSLFCRFHVFFLRLSFLSSFRFCITFLITFIIKISEKKQAPGRHLPPAGDGGARYDVAHGALGGRDAGRIWCHLGRAEPAEQAGHPESAGGRAAEGPDAADAPGRDKVAPRSAPQGVQVSSRRCPARSQVSIIYVCYSHFMFSSSKHWQFFFSFVVSLK